MDAKDERRAKTEATMALVAGTARKLGVGHIIVASNSGDTAVALFDAVKAEFGPGKRPELVCVTHCVGFTGDGLDEMTAEMREGLALKGFKVLTTTHLFGGVERAMTNTWKGLYPLNMVANALKLFGQGAKVAVEISVMALDSGLIPFGRDVIAIGGSGRGGNTALLIRPAHAIKFFDTKVKQVIAMSG